MRYFIMIIMILILSACAGGGGQTSMSIDMYNGSGDMVGTAELKESSEGVDVVVNVEGLEPGFHGVHVHEFPKCEGPDFKSAGSHLNPEGQEHGLMHTDGPHLGDLKNVESEDGTLSDIELTVEEATMLDGKNSIRQKGSSLIITEGQDDGVTQPSGDSGARIICGEITPEENNTAEEPTDPTQNNEEQES